MLKVQISHTIFVDISNLVSISFSLYLVICSLCSSSSLFFCCAFTSLSHLLYYICPFLVNSKRNTSLWMSPTGFGYCSWRVIKDWGGEMGTMMMIKRRWVGETEMKGYMMSKNVRKVHHHVSSDENNKRIILMKTFAREIIWNHLLDEQTKEEIPSIQLSRLKFPLFTISSHSSIILLSSLCVTDTRLKKIKERCPSLSSSWNLFHLSWWS